QVRRRSRNPENKTMDDFESAFLHPFSPETHYPWDNPELNLFKSPMKPSSVSADKGGMDHLSEIRIVMLGQRTDVQNIAGNIILGREEFHLWERDKCVKRQREVAGRMITVVQTPGWRDRGMVVTDPPGERRYKHINESFKQEIVLSVSMCPPGPHAVLLVLRLYCSSWENEKKMLEKCMMLLTERVWSHTIVLFTCGEFLGNQTIEEYIAGQGKDLQRLIEKCGNRYHVFYTIRNNTQVTELLEKIEKMVAGNSGCHLEIDPKTVQDTEKRKKLCESEDWEKRMKVSNQRDDAKITSTPSDNPDLNLFKSPMKPSSVSADKDQVRRRSWIPKNKTMDHFDSAFFRPVSPETHYSKDLELLDEKCSEDEDRKNYRILWLHAGQFMCKFSNLVFKMEGKVKVQYRIESWNCCNLDGLGQKQPAGPLYSIKCPEGSIHRLHLPHCETRKHMRKLTVAHVTEDNVEIIQPLKVTNTHVIIDIQSLSLFGILKELLFQAHPIRAQVLLFYQRGMNKLYIHLVPGNVPVEEVQKRHESNTTYIMTSSKCNLVPGRIYIPCCKATECDYVSQPENETFDYEYGPNYHPTFEVLLSTEVKQVTLSLLDEKGKLVWKPRVVLLK
ncbi:NACHT, LRR and PYD domains-containing protein 1b allele 2-like, partial [Clarias magur]